MPVASLDEIRAQAGTEIGVSSWLTIDQPRIQEFADAIFKDGLKPGDIRRIAGTFVSGDEVSDIHRNNKVYDIMVWGTPRSRQNVADIRNMLLDTPGGGHVRMSQVASVRILPTPNQIEREEGSRRIDVAMGVDGRGLGAVVDDVRDRLQAVSFPRGYHAEVLGEFQEREAAQGRIFNYGLAAAIGIFVLLQTCIRRFRIAVLAFVTLPFALVGGALATFATDGLITLGSLVGFLTVFGIAARNGILLINHYQHLEVEEGEPFGPELVLRGSRERLAPILMTALATGLALVPLVVSGEIPGAEIEYPMAIVILGGLITSTLLNLFVLPALYLRFGRVSGAPPAQETTA